ncbi:MAG: hypothetical protein PHY27_03080 [Parabacteroides sp.]|jgi:hypothetical protein|uniref:Glutathione synthase/RimK-type ligase, ATP-grasp superfamily n=1 Tax=Parabacteroides chartae TaxID=1037355 RepID=A0A1T5BZX0_9BACT|nr:hypothetical protein [Parabacteroides chartae]MBP7939076.1 hypothetical protein [Parabacteroides sp.]MDT3369667.1 hypothetical protein [Bacteroidota bacterium]HAD01294.1 hypothetical protein [Porphyromonadaceae bacterium]HNP91268.1 hypothetical protein [Macellibacteroides fermentans]MCD8471857.1 hypothetical protein [Parabacteroides chartae]
MKQNKIAGIVRGNCYSPNHVGNDAAVFNETIRHLELAGYEVTTYTEEDVLNREVLEPVIFTMARSKEVVEKLKEYENRGAVVVNSGYGISNCTREQMTRLLVDNNIPHPRSIITPTKDHHIAQRLKEEGMDNCWIKRGDFHAIHREDVTYVRHIEEAEGILSEYALRGIPNAVINEHLVGDLVKFYGVAGSDFFYWFYPFNMNHSKFGHEQINGKATGIAFSVEDMHAICERSAQVLKVKIYGGDCIISPEGEIRIIDFNDWPSFAPCRDQAAPHIARCIIESGKDLLA